MSLQCGCDIDRPDLQVEEWRKARKNYICIECGKLIKKGDQYQLWTSLFDGLFSRDRTCEKCADLRSSMMELGYCMEWGELHNDHSEYLAQQNRPQQEICK